MRWINSSLKTYQSNRTIRPRSHNWELWKKRLAKETKERNGFFCLFQKRERQKEGKRRGDGDGERVRREMEGDSEEERQWGGGRRREGGGGGREEALQGEWGRGEGGMACSPSQSFSALLCQYVYFPILSHCLQASVLLLDTICGLVYSHE